MYRTKRILICFLAVIVVLSAVMGGCAQPSEEGRLFMKLRGDRELYVECNRPYVEPGAFASYKSSGQTQTVAVDITGDTVDTGKLGTYLLKYTAVCGDRVATSYRRVHVVDTEKPQIQLVGAQYYTMNVGQPYAELGCVATDNYDGDLSDQVQITGTLDRNRPGEYELVYTVTDSYQNSVSINRTVCVEEWNIEEGQIPYIAQPNGKVIYLTFDDGPSQYTPKLLDVLKKYNVKATFFVVNTGFIDTVKRIAAEGHTLALHTTSHVYKEIYASEDAYFKDLYAIQKKVRDLTGQESTLIRFPGGSSNRSSSFNPGIMTRLTKLVGEKGFTYFDWTIDSKDTGGAKTPEAVCQNVIAGVQGASRDYSIVLQHDIKSYSVDAVESIILWGLANGYTFLPMDENTPAYHHTVRN